MCRFLAYRGEPLFCRIWFALQAPPLCVNPYSLKKANPGPMVTASALAGTASDHKLPCIARRALLGLMRIYKRCATMCGHDSRLFVHRQALRRRARTVIHSLTATGYSCITGGSADLHKSSVTWRQ